MTDFRRTADFDSVPLSTSAPSQGSTQMKDEIEREIQRQVELFDDVGLRVTEAAKDFARAVAREVAEAYERAAIASIRKDDELRDAWQPIETAPKDGTHVDLWLDNPALVVGGQRVTDAFWYEGRWLEWSPVNDLDEAQYYAPLVGPCEAVETGICKATHWRPLPEPPTALSSVAGDGDVNEKGPAQSLRGVGGGEGRGRIGSPEEQGG